MIENAVAFFGLNRFARSVKPFEPQWGWPRRAVNHPVCVSVFPAAPLDPAAVEVRVRDRLLAPCQPEGEREAPRRAPCRRPRAGARRGRSPHRLRGEPGEDAVAVARAARLDRVAASRLAFRTEVGPDDAVVDHVDGAGPRVGEALGDEVSGVGPRDGHAVRRASDIAARMRAPGARPGRPRRRRGAAAGPPGPPGRPARGRKAARSATDRRQRRAAAAPVGREHHRRSRIAPGGRAEAIGEPVPYHVEARAGPELGQRQGQRRSGPRS